MHLHFRTLHLIPVFIGLALADFSGPSYPAPVDLSSANSLVVPAWKNITSTIQTYLDSSPQDSALSELAEIQNLTFSLGIFSLNDRAASELQFHHTSAEIANAPNGTNKVDGDSIYRIASVTKVFTVLAGLLELKTTDWDRPLPDIFPALADFVQKSSGGSDPAYTTQWNEVTPSALAAQIAGVARDLNPYSPGEIIAQILSAQAAGEQVPDATTLGFPPMPIDQSNPLAFPPCVFVNCTTITYFEGAEIRAPAFAPWTTPGYSDNGFILLGQAIAQITGKNLDQVYRESIFDPLDMTSSNSSTPPESEWHRSVIPGDLTNFVFDTGVLISTGGLSSTLRDFAKLGVGILNSTLLPPDVTRKWLKPVSHTACLQYSVGRPWEIMRYTHPSGHITDIYPKSGDSGVYSSWLVLFPDYNAGFSVLSAGSLTTRFEVVASLAELINDSILPALEAQAQAEAERNFAGTYDSKIQGLNSSITLVQNQTATSSPGLAISSWVSNGTDVLVSLRRRLGPTPWRLVPTNTGEAVFRLVSGSDAPSPEAPAGLFSGPGFLSADWISLDSSTYGSVGTGLFVFDVGPDGKATAVSPAAFRVTLERIA